MENVCLANVFQTPRGEKNLNKIVELNGIEPSAS
jgi:hypothetical protein